MISCKKAVELLSKGMDEPLNETEQQSLRIHLHICEFCEQFRKHIEKIRGALRNVRDVAATARTLSADAKARLLQKLKAK